MACASLHVSVCMFFICCFFSFVLLSLVYTVQKLAGSMSRFTGTLQIPLNYHYTTRIVLQPHRRGENNIQIRSEWLNPEQTATVLEQNIFGSWSLFQDTFCPVYITCTFDLMSVFTSNNESGEK